MHCRHSHSWQTVALALSREATPLANTGTLEKLQISGLVIIGVTLWTIFWKHQYISLLSTTNYVIGTYALLAAGLLAVVGGVLGCCGVWHEQRGVLVLYTFVLLIVFLLEFIVGGLAYLYETQIETELQHTLNATFMEHYGVSEQQTKAVDSLQQERRKNNYLITYLFPFFLFFLLASLIPRYAIRSDPNRPDPFRLCVCVCQYTCVTRKCCQIDLHAGLDWTQFSCCGAVRFEDWRHSVWLRSRRKDLIKPTEGRLVPDSCCITVVSKCGLRDGPSNIHYTGCIYEMTDDLKYHLIILGAIGLGLSVIQVFGMVLSCCLYVKLKNVLD
uniref:Uncharacterized protein n=1 Tax=Anopheles stephensi TaxID=30069 RepID=A0A182YE10_ANOST